MKIKGVFFDLGYTLEEPVSGHWFLTPKFYEYYPKEQFDALTDTSKRAEVEKDLYTFLKQANGVTTCKQEEDVFVEFFLRLAKDVPLPDMDEQRAREIAHDRVSEFTKYRYLPKTRKTLAELQKKGYKVGLISDTWPSSGVQFDETGLTPYFDTITLSCNLGITKPDPEMWLHTLRVTGLKAEESIFVDDLIRNLEAAEKLGFHAVQSLADLRIPVDGRFPTVHNPGEIFDVIKQLESK